MADAIACGRIACAWAVVQIRVLRKEKKLTSADGGRNCVRMRCMAWAVDADEG